MYDIPFDRSFLQLSNGIRYVMPSTDKARINSIGLDGSASHRRTVCSNGLNLPLNSLSLYEFDKHKPLFDEKNL